jgi:hypothetical protein
MKTNILRGPVIENEPEPEAITGLYLIQSKSFIAKIDSLKSI